MLADVGRYSVREILIERGILSEREISEIEKFKNETGWSFAKICLTLGFVSRKKWAELFKELGYEIIDIKKEKVDVKTLSYLNMLVMEQYLGVPLRKENGEVIVAMCDPTDVEFIEMVKKIFKMEVKVIFAIDVDIVWVLHKYLGPPFCRIAIYNLLWNDPDRSAVLTFTPRQIAVILALITAYLAFFSFNPTQAIILINIIIGLLYLLTILFKFTLTIVGSKYEIQETVTDEELKNLTDDELPVYTILLPVYKEPKVIKKLVENISRLDYPRFKLDVKLLLEEDDFETINAIREIDFPAIFEPLVVPYGEPKTKPKACDYGLLFARGKYLTIYDAEDIPEVDQLKKSSLCLRNCPTITSASNVHLTITTLKRTCLQGCSRLNIHIGLITCFPGLTASGYRFRLVGQVIISKKINLKNLPAGTLLMSPKTQTSV
jgi:hypothetical protein